MKRKTRRFDDGGAVAESVPDPGIETKVIKEYEPPKTTSKEEYVARVLSALPPDARAELEGYTEKELSPVAKLREKVKRLKGVDTLDTTGTKERLQEKIARYKSAKEKTGYKSGGSVSSASKRGDGCAQRGKTKGRMV